ncbi:cytosolic carboxypeptidase 2 [Cynoglossus semilaevis]|uniref:Cytosolic carboxypeptidase 2 n=1 Tax=Cynoglossus semilaevis TaxID=244447 RepID=A0A3P8WC45_CYNSE|nr:cytosolic carboxypeptidase 2-like [Cynoglossus semilaevis]
MAGSALRNWWNSARSVESNSSYSSTEEDEGRLLDRRQLSAKLHRSMRTKQLLVDFDGSRPVFSLRAPRDLVNLPLISRPHWPIEREVISDIIHHIEWDPPEPEPFYQPTGQERTPMPVGEDRGKVVFLADHATKQPYFTCSRSGGTRGPIRSATCDIRDFTLHFESRFESGNLHKVVQVGAYDYELTLRTDMYTNKHTQWFYFRVGNMKTGVTYRFTIVNLMKSSSLYSLGMKPLLYSEKSAVEKGVGWKRVGSDISYYRNCSPNAMENNSSDSVTLYSLTWTLQFPHDSDTCYLAHCYPYTYSHLQHYLRCVFSNPKVASYCSLRVLCHSMAGNTVYVLTITNRGSKGPGGRTKKAVVVTARVHPGETNSSWMMEGLLDFLLGDSDDAQLLRDIFVFKVVPMLNPDGVVVGNYRCSLVGRDLNRNYKTTLRDSFPCVWHTRNMVKRLMAEMDVVLYCDFHGHNRKNNVFMYGCSNKSDAASLKLQEKVFPLMMSKNMNNKFSFRSCKFRVQKSKEGTGRVAMWRLGIRNCYTMEATFGGSTLGDRRGTHFTTGDLKSLGFYFCDTLLDYCDPDQTKTICCLAELTAMLRKEVKERLGKEFSPDCDISMSDIETSTSGSNSSDSDGLPLHLLPPHTVHPQQTPVKKQKKSLKSYKDRNRMRQERVKNSTETTVPRGSTKNDPRLTHEMTVKMNSPEKPDERHRRKWQKNDVTNNAVITPPNNHADKVTQMSMWHCCQPAEEECQDTVPPYSHHHTDNLRMETSHWRCSSQLLTLRALMLPTQSIMYPSHHHYHYLRPSHITYKVLRGMIPSISTAHRSPSSLCVRRAPDKSPSKHLLSSHISNKSDSQYVYRDRSSLRTAEYYIIPQDFSRAHTDMKEDDALKVGLSVLECRPFGEQRNSSPSVSVRKPRSYSSLIVPMLKGSDQERMRLCKETSSVPKPLYHIKTTFPHSHTSSRLQRSPDNAETGCPKTDGPVTAVKNSRKSQSAPL